MRRIYVWRPTRRTGKDTGVLVVEFQLTQKEADALIAVQKYSLAKGPVIFAPVRSSRNSLKRHRQECRFSIRHSSRAF